MLAGNNDYRYSEAVRFLREAEIMRVRLRVRDLSM